MTKRYQQGHLELVKTAAGLCWHIRFTNPPGIKPFRPRFRVGLKSQIPTEAKASRAAQHLREQFNVGSAELADASRTFRDVITRYEAEEMPQRYSTSRGYRQLHRLYIEPRWGASAVTAIDPLEVRAWLNMLELSTRTRGHIHSQMRLLFRFAMLWKWMPATLNPMSLFSVKGATKRTRVPRTITPEQFRALVAAQPDVTVRAMIVGAYCLGLRASELFALQWGDVDFLEGRVFIRRAIVDGRVGGVKTERSEAPIPLGKPVADALLAAMQRSAFREPSDWVFASPALAGERPLNSQHVQFNTLRAAGKGAGLDFSLGWHTFRHSFKNLLKATGSEPEMMRDLLRHSDTHTTMNVYGEPEFDRMRQASERALAVAFGI